MIKLNTKKRLLFTVFLIIVLFFRDYPSSFQISQVEALSAGPKYPATVATSKETGDDNGWTTESNVGGDDGSYAYITASTFDSGDQSWVLRATNLSMGVPTNARIDGIVVEIERHYENGAVADMDVCLTKNGSTRVGDNKSTGATFNLTTDTMVSFGGVADKWNTTWTVAEVNASTFGVIYKMTSTGTDSDGFVDYIRVTVSYTLPTMTVGTTGSQTSNLSIPSTNSYVGGAFTFVTDINTATVTQIIITDTGTVNANSNLSNVDIYYETAGTCTYDANETLFGTGASFNVSEKATITGTMSVGTSQVCVYVVLDVGSGASASQTIEIEITNPSTEVTITNGSVTPASIVAILGTSTLIAPTVSCNASNGSTDFGALTNLVITTSSPDIIITSSCTYTGGCTITVKDQGNTSSPGLYRSVAPVHLINSATATLSTGTEGYGIQATTAGSLTINSKYIKTGNDVGGLTTTDTNLAISSATYSDQTIVITHKAAISNLTTAGNYSDTITYSCSGN